MKKSIISLALSMIALNADTLNLNMGWNLVGSSNNIDVTKFNNSHIKIIWKYENGKWQGYSPSNEMKNLITNNGIDIFEKTNPNDGFWIYSDSNIVIDTDSNDTSYTTLIGKTFYIADYDVDDKKFSSARSIVFNENNLTIKDTSDSEISYLTIPYKIDKKNIILDLPHATSNISLDEYPIDFDKNETMSIIGIENGIIEVNSSDEISYWTDTQSKADNLATLFNVKTMGYNALIDKTFYSFGPDGGVTNHYWGYFNYQKDGNISGYDAESKSNIPANGSYTYSIDDTNNSKIVLHYPIDEDGVYEENQTITEINIPMGYIKIHCIQNDGWQSDSYITLNKTTNDTLMSKFQTDAIQTEFNKMEATNTWSAKLLEDITLWTMEVQEGQEDTGIIHKFVFHHGKMTAYYEDGTPIDYTVPYRVVNSSGNKVDYGLLLETNESAYNPDAVDGIEWYKVISVDATKGIISINDDDNGLDAELDSYHTFVSSKFYLHYEDAKADQEKLSE